MNLLLSFGTGHGNIDTKFYYCGCLTVLFSLIPPVTMTTIVNKNGDPVAYLHLNIILDLQQQKVLGLILGNCVFGLSDAPVGKFFNNCFRKRNGNIVARLDKETNCRRPPMESAVLQEAWQRLTTLRVHVCMWIEERDTWTGEDFLSYLSMHERDMAEMAI